MNRKPKRRRESVWPKLLLAVVTLLQVSLSILLHVLNRQETLKVIQNEDEMTLLQNAKKVNRKLE